MVYKWSLLYTVVQAFWLDNLALADSFGDCPLQQQTRLFTKRTYIDNKYQEHLFNKAVLAATRILNASSLPGATFLSGCNNTASRL